MKHEEQTISVKVACLIIGYLHNSLTESEKDALDDWICLSDENIEIFAQLTDRMDGDVFNPDDLIVETENVIDLWIIASLIVRRKIKINSKVEDRYLDEWIKADKQNKELFEKLQHPAYMQKMLVWNELKRQELFA
jgi:hypothetical protein